jgi:hypothetical protein
MDCKISKNDIKTIKSANNTSLMKNVKMAIIINIFGILFISTLFLIIYLTGKFMISIFQLFTIIMIISTLGPITSMLVISLLNYRKKWNIQKWGPNKIK